LEDYRKANNLHAAASFGWGIFEGSGSSDFYSSGRFTKFNNFLLIEVTVLNPAEILSTERLTTEALDRAREGSESFIDACGDEFVDKRQTGGEFAVIAQFGSTTAEQQQQVQTNVKVAVHAFFIGGEGEASFGEALSTLSNITDTHIEILRTGGSGNLPNLAAVKDYALTFPASISTETHNAATMYVVTKELSSILGLPRNARDFSSVSQQRVVLEHYAEILDRAYEAQGNLNFIGQHPDQFVNLDNAKLDMAITGNRAIIRGLKEKAENCRRSVHDCQDPPDQSFSDFQVQRRGQPAGPVVPPPVVPPPAPQWITLDPTTVTLVGTVGIGEFKTLEARGAWNPGPDRPCYGPIGANDATLFPPLGPNAFGVQYRFVDLDTGSIFRDWTSYKDAPVQTPHGVKVFARMADTIYTDNHQCTPPMRAILY